MPTKLLEQLPESNRRRRGGAAVSRAGTAASVAAHAALITLAVVATGLGQGGPERPPKPTDEHPIYVVTRRDPPRTSSTTERRASSVGAARRDAEPPLPPMPTFHPQVEGPFADPPRPVIDDFGGGSAAGDATDRVGEGSGGGAGTTSEGSDAPYDARVVEVPAALRAGSPVPRYPDALRASRAAGRVLVRFVVDTAGRVEPASVRVLSSTHPLFTSAVRSTLPALRFTPARVRGAKVRQLVEVPFEFAVE